MGLGLWDEKEYERGKKTTKEWNMRERERVCVVFIVQHLSPREAFQKQLLFILKVNSLY